MGKEFLMGLAIGIGLVACSSSHFFPGAPAGKDIGPQGVRTQGTLEALSPSGEQDLHSILRSAKLTNLQWPHFADHVASAREFYTETGYKLAWSHGGKATEQALELISILEQAEKKGLNSKDYDGDRWSDRVKTLQHTTANNESERVRFDVALTVSGIRYVSDLHLGRVDPGKLHRDFDPERQHHDPGVFLQKEVIGAQSVKGVLAQIECPYPGYQRELLALQRYLEMEKEEVRPALPQAQTTVEPGGIYAGSALLAQRLHFLGDLSPSVVTGPHQSTYSKEIAEGVKSFQFRHGMDVDGKLRPQVITELNRPVIDRVQQLRLALERWRWLPHTFNQPPIIVNIPEFKLRAGEMIDKPALVMSVVVGKAMRTQTPVLEEDMEYVVFWPYWNVPRSIIRGEMIPKISDDSEYLQRNNYEVTTNSGKVVSDGPVSDDIVEQLRTGKLTVRQKPGPKNALGLVKFIFPNDNNVYLHSTPAQALFSRSRRDFSHGCIRVADPQALAEWVLQNNPGWTKERIAETFAAGKQQQVNLTHIIPVLILYSSAIAEENGQVLFLQDIYGHDKALAKLEAQAYVSNN